MKKITHSQFVAVLSARNGAVILSIVAETDPRPRKTGNPFKEIRKEQYIRVVTGADYKAAVERQGGQGFQPDALPYGEFEVKNKIIKTSSGKLQLRTQARNPQKPIAVRWTADGQPVDWDSVKAFIPVKTPSRKQEAVGVKGKKQVLVRNFDLANIKRVTIKGGEQMELIPD